MGCPLSRYTGEFISKLWYQFKKKKNRLRLWGCDAVRFVMYVLTFYFIATLTKGAHFLIKYYKMAYS